MVVSDSVKKYVVWGLTILVVGAQHVFPQYNGIINDIVAVAVGLGLHLHIGNE